MITKETLATQNDFRIMRLRTELAFIFGDRAHGGPSRENEVEDLLIELRTLTEEL